MRLFLAIELPELSRHHFAVALDNLRRPWTNIRWVNAANLHLTLKFLGEVEDRAVAPLSDAIHQALRSPEPLQLQPDHAELLPPRGRLRVVAAGISGEVEPLRMLVDQIETACTGCGFRREHRPFRPHITLGRTRVPVPSSSRGALANDLQAYLPAPSFTVTSFSLIESHLGAGGSRYVRLADFPLAGG